MISLRAFSPSDLIGFCVQAGQRDDVPEPENYAVDILRRGGESITARAPDGTPIMVCGVVQGDDQLGVAWALLSAQAGPWLLPLTRATRLFFDQLECATVMISVDMRHPAFPRWAAMLGFEDRGMVQWQRDPNQHLFVREKI